MASSQFETEGPYQKLQSLSMNNHALEIEVADGTTVMDVGRGNQPVRFNSRSFSNASGSAIGFQCKPAASVDSTGDIIGGEISPRVNNDIDLTGSIIGLHVDAYLKGTAAKTVGGDVRGAQIELVTDDAGVTAVTGDVVGLRMRSAFSATVTGDFKAIEIEKPETQTGSVTYDAVLSLTDEITGVWEDTSAVGSTSAGFIKVLVNDSVRYIQLFSDLA